MKLHSLWATPVAEFSLNDTIRSHALDRVRSLIPAAIEHNNTRPWASTDLLHEQPEFGVITAWIMSVSGRLLDHWAIERSAHRITGLWANVQGPNQEHAPHAHANSLISGCLYLDVPEDASCIEYYDPRPAAAHISLNAGEEWDWARSVVMQPRNGLCLLWPSWLVHRTVSMARPWTNRPRVSLAFNLHVQALVSRHSARMQFV